MAGRALFICSAKAGPELWAGNADCEKFAKVLRDPRFGVIDETVSPPMFLDCDDDSEFLSRINKFFKMSADAEQRIVYITGHGRVVNGGYCLVFDGKNRLPFSAVVGLLVSRGAAKTLFVLDTCHSGAAEMGGIKSDELMPIVPAGSCIFASSKDYELSHEHEEHGSVFTHFLCECITTGNGGQRTTKGLITVPDAVTYIKAKIIGLGKPDQSPIYSIRNSDGALWIARNISGATDTQLNGDADKLRRPCLGARVKDLDADQTKAYAERYLGTTVKDLESVLPALDLYCSTADQRLTEAAILCFGARPERFFPASGSVFSAGNLASSTMYRLSVEGPLVAQAEKLLQQTLSQLSAAVTFGEEVQRNEEPEIPVPVLREVILNSLAHRDFDAAGRVHVHVDDDKIEIKNPGQFPPDYGWEAILAAPGVSLTPNRRITNHLQHVGVYEGVGRGFSVLRDYRDERGEQAVSFRQTPGMVVCRLQRPKKRLLTAGGVDLEAERLGVQRYLHERVDMMSHVRSVISGASQFVSPTLRMDDGEQLSLNEMRNLLRSPGNWIVVEGGVGSGKSRLLRHLALGMAQDRLRGGVGEDTPIPVLVALRVVSTDNPLLSNLRRAVGETPGFLEHVLDHPNVTVMFDGLDEAPASIRDSLLESIVRFHRQFRHVTVVISSRPIEMLSRRNVGKRITIGPLSRDAVADFVRQARPQYHQRILQALDDSRDFAGNPLLLDLMVAAFDHFAEFPSNPDILADQAIDLLFFRHDASKAMFRRVHQSGLNLDEFVRVAGLLALFMVSRSLLSLSDEQYVTAIGQAVGLSETTALPQDIAVDLLEIGLMRRDGPTIEFVHLSLMERLLVRAVARQNIPVRAVAALMARLLEMNRTSDLPLKIARLWGRTPERIQDLILQLGEQRVSVEAIGARNELALGLEIFATELPDSTKDFFDLFGKGAS